VVDDEKPWSGEEKCSYFGGIIREATKGCCGRKRKVFIISCVLRNGVPFYADTVCRRQLCRNYEMRNENEDRSSFSGEELSGLLSGSSKT